MFGFLFLFGMVALGYGVGLLKRCALVRMNRV
jgi:hypothetical protein